MEFSIKVKNQTYYSLEDFAKNIYLYPNESLTVIKSQKFLKILYKYDEKMYNDIVGILESPNQIDECLFKIQYTLNPLMGLRHHGYIFDSFKALGKQIISFAPRIDIYLKDFLKYRLLSYYMEKTRYDEKEPNLYRSVLDLEKEFHLNENRVYFKLGFLLNGLDDFIYNNKKFSDHKKFLSYVMEPVNISGFSKTFINSQYLLAYLELKGYQKEITLFENFVLSIEQKEKKNDDIRKI